MKVMTVPNRSVVDILDDGSIVAFHPDGSAQVAKLAWSSLSGIVVTSYPPPQIKRKA